MTFLKKLGEIIVKGLGIATGLLPLVQQLSPGQAGLVQTISQDLSQIAQIIVMVEAAGATLGIAGPDKLRMAAPQIAQILLQSTILVGRPIANPQLLLRAATKFADGMADALNSVHPAAAIETPVASSPA